LFTGSVVYIDALSSMSIQQITCFGSGTLAIACHAKSGLNRDNCRLPFGVGLLLFSFFGPVNLTVDALLTVNLFRSIAAAFILDAIVLCTLPYSNASDAFRDSHLISGTVDSFGFYSTVHLFRPATLLLSSVSLLLC
jgi:hypothetical protein